MVTEGLAPMDVGKMYLDDRQPGRQEGVHDGDRGVRIGARIDDDAVMAAARGLDPADQLAFAVRLAALRLEAQGLRVPAATLLDVGEGFASVDIGLAAAEQERKSTRLNSSH